MNKLLTSLLLAIAFLCNSQINLPLESKSILPSDYSWHNQNWDFAQSNDGIMLIANGDGLIEYDGHVWSIHKTKLESSVLSLCMNGSKDTLYAGGIGEFGYFTKDQFGTYQFSDLSILLHDTLRNFGHVWYTIHNGNQTAYMSGSYLFIFKNNEFIKHFRAKNIFRGCNLIGDDLFFQDFQQENYVLDKDLNQKVTSFSDSIGKGAIYKITPYSEDELLIFSQFNLFLYNAKKQEVRVLENDLPYAENDGSLVFSDIIELSDGGFVLNIAKYGLYFINKYGKTSDYYGLETLNFNSGINKFFEDESGAIWVGTNKGVSILFKNLPFRIMREPEHYQGIGNVFTRHNNKYYLGTNEGVYELDEKERKMNSIPAINIYTFNFLSSYNTLLITSMDGFFRLNNNRIERLNEHYSREIISVNHPSKDSLFLSTGKTSLAIQKLKKNSSTDTLLFLPSLMDEAIRIVQEPIQKEEDSLFFWVGLMSKGLAKVTVDKNLSGSTVKYYSSNPVFDPGYILPAYLDNELVFFGRSQQALVRNEKNEFVDHDFFKKILGSATSYLSAQDEKGNIFLEAYGPLMILTKEDESYFVDSTSFKGIGLGFLNFIYPDEDCVWLIWEQGITQIFNTFQKKDHTPLRVVFHEINYGKIGNKLNPHSSEEVTIAYNENDINFRFGSPYYRKNEELLFSFKLEGYDNDFSPWIIDRKAFYTNLPDGDYIFMVKVKNHQDKESKVLSYSFTIQTPWYKSAWAYIFYFILGGALIYTLIQLNAYRLKAANVKLQNLVDEKTTEVKKQNDNLKQKNLEIENQRVLLEEKNKDIIDSINYAKHIQTALLQSEDQVDSELPEHFVLFQPKDIVSGDFYWARKKMNETENHWYVTVGDCTGHGVPGAFLTMLATSFLNETIIDKTSMTPAVILNDLRRKIIKDLNQNDDNPNRDGMDMALIRLNLNNLMLDYAGAYNPLWIIRNGEIIEIKADKFPVSYQNNSSNFTNHTFQMQKGDVVYLFSDGYPDQFGGTKVDPLFEELGIRLSQTKKEGKKLKSANFKRILLTIHKQPLKEQKQTLLNFLELWKGPLEAVDDICIIGIRL